MTHKRALADVLQSVSRGSDGDTPLHVLAWQCDCDGARLLIDAGADVNAQGEMGYTPLHAAIAQGDLKFVELLLAAGADPDIRSEFGSTAREEAMKRDGAIAEIVRQYARIPDSSNC